MKTDDDGEEGHANRAWSLKTVSQSTWWVSLWKMVNRKSLTGKLRMLRGPLERTRGDEEVRQEKSEGERIVRVVTGVQLRLWPDGAR